MIWHHESPEAIAKELETNLETGLSQEEAAERLAEYGQNRYHEKHTTPILKEFGKQLRSLPMTLVTAAAVFMLCFHILVIYFGGQASLIEPFLMLLLPPLGHLTSVVWQKHATSKLHHLTNVQTSVVKVLREGEMIEINAAEVVRGDVLFLEQGMIVPADCRLITAEDLACDEYVITGEDIDIPKNADVTLDGITVIGDRVNMIYAGCGISHGSGTALVVSTGQSTEYALKLNDPDNQTSPLPGISKDIATIEKLISLPILVLSFIVLVVGVLRNLTGLNDVLSVISPTLMMAAVAIPTGLTVAAVVSMTMGMHHVVSRSADVRELAVMDTLSSVTVICAHKTTLTDDHKKPVRVFTGEFETLSRFPSERAQTLIRLATLCTASDTITTGIDNHLVANPTESAIIEYARDLGMERRLMMEETPRLAEIPFDTDRRRMSVVHLVAGRRLMITMGAPESVLSLCTAGPLEKAEEANRHMAGHMMRVLAIAYKYVDDLSGAELDESQESDMIFAGLIALADQLRDDSAAAVADCEKSGIITIMITGDNEATACAVAHELGIDVDESQVLTGDELHAMTYEEFDRTITTYRVFARISPSDKETIIRAWQKRGAIVASTGNGLADVPALQRADIGCATGAADCDMTRNESDLTLYDNSFSSLVDAIKQARGIYANIRKVLQYTLTCSVALIVATLITLLAHRCFVLSPASMALYFIIGTLCALAIAYESGDRHALGEKPRKGLSRLLPAPAVIETLWQGALTGVCAFIAFDAGQSGTPAVENIELTTAYGLTTAFITLILSRLWMMWITRRRDPDRPMFANRVMPSVFIVCLALTAVVLFIPAVTHCFGLTTVSVSNWVLALILSVIPAAVAAIVRLVTNLLSTVKRTEHNTL